MKRFILALAALAVMFTSCQSGDDSTIVDVVPSQEKMQRPFGKHDRKAFVAPDKVHYPQTWFHYIGGNVSHEGITADLEAIAGAGI